MLLTVSGELSIAFLEGCPFLLSLFHFGWVGWFCCCCFCWCLVGFFFSFFPELKLNLKLPDG